MQRIYLTLADGKRAAFNVDQITVVAEGGGTVGTEITTTDCAADVDAHWNVTESYDDVIARLCYIDDCEKRE